MFFFLFLFFCFAFFEAPGPYNKKQLVEIRRRIQKSILFLGVRYSYMSESRALLQSFIQPEIQLTQGPGMGPGRPHTIHNILWCVFHHTQYSTWTKVTENIQHITHQRHETSNENTQSFNPQGSRSQKLATTNPIHQTPYPRRLLH